jgi:hypothetical protein
VRRLSIAVLSLIGVPFLLIAGLSGVAGGPSTALGGVPVATQAPYTLTKVADQQQVLAGSPIGFVMTVTVQQTDGITWFIEDDLPGGPGINWTIASSSGVDGCLITGSAPHQHLECVGLGGHGMTVMTVHVVSETTTASCGTYQNSALAGYPNFDDLTADASTTVACASPTPTPTPPPGTATPTATPKPPDITGTTDARRIDLTYNPGDEASICDKIVFVQTVTNTVENTGDPSKKKTSVKPTDLNVKDAATKDTWQTDGGSYVDAGATEYDPYYNGWDSPDDGVDADGNQEDSNHQGKKPAAGAATKATMNDTPSGYSDDAFKALSQKLYGDDTTANKLTKEFTDVIFCAEGDDAGHCFGWYTWTFTQVKGQAAKANGGAAHSGNPPADAVAALNKWKDKHPGNDVPAVACP